MAMQGTPGYSRGREEGGEGGGGGGGGGGSGARPFLER